MPKNRAGKFLLLLPVLLIWGCGLFSVTIPPTETAQVLPTVVGSGLPASTLAEPSSMPAPSATASPSSTPNSLQGLGLPSFYLNLQNVQQYVDPTGQPVKTWHDVPIMPQATAGQDFNNGVYSYKAVATLKQAVDFYSAINTGRAPPTVATGSSGTGVNAAHEATFIYPDMLIYVMSYDDNKSHIIVVISK